MFIKLSKCEKLAHWELPAEGGAPQIVKNAAVSIPSFYANPGQAGVLDVSAALSKVAKEYNISADPVDYVYEAVRAVTAGVPNENGDAFHRDELLRHDHRLGCAVYQTFILKPHHVNHKAENPKTARGVILDAHYNDDAPPKDSCPSCNSRTAEREDRDRTGLYCRKCGTLVKDEFIEILLAVDKKKDAAFAEGVRTGVLNATSMGCVCDSTTCNVCEHVAYSKQEFCKHIRSGKKKTFKTASGDKVAFEWCNNVVFTEDSRVDQPADPTALQREVLQLAAQKEAESAKPDSLRNESELLILSKRIADLENRLAQSSSSVSAPPDPVDPTNDDPTSEPHSIDTLVEKENDEGAEDPHTMQEMGIKVMTGPGGNNPVGDPGGGGGSSIMTTIKSGAARAASDLDSILFATTASPDKGLIHMAQSNFKFRTAYQAIKAQVTEQGNVRIANDKGTLFVVEAAEPLDTVEARNEFGAEVLRHIAEFGLVRTMNAFSASPSPKMAGIIEDGIYDFDGGRKDGDSKPAAAGGDDDMASKERGEGEKDIMANGETDRASKAPPKSHKEHIHSDSETDFDGGHESPPSEVAGESHETQTSKHSKGKDTVYGDGDSDLASKKPKKAQKTAGSPNQDDNGWASRDEGDGSKEEEAASRSKAHSKAKEETSKFIKSKKGPPSKSKPASKHEAAPPAPPAEGPPDMSNLSDDELNFDNATSKPQPDEAAQVNDGGAAGLWLKFVPQLGAAGLTPEAKAKVQEVSKLIAGNGNTNSPGVTSALSAIAGSLATIEAAAGGGNPAETQAAVASIEQAMDAMLDVLGGGAAGGMDLTAPPGGDPMGAPGGSDVIGPEGLPPPPPQTGVVAGKKTAKEWKKPWEGKSKRPSKEASKSAEHSKTASTSKVGCGSKHGTSKCSCRSASAEAKKYESRMERIYKTRFAKLEQERDAAVDKVAVVVAEKFTRALKVAAARQRLNLEESPIKIAFADALLTPTDLPGDEYFPGMDMQLTQTLIERAASDGFGPFVDRLVERAAEFLKMSDEAFTAIEADVKNLQPVLPVAADAGRVAGANVDKRTAARQGNMHLAPAPSEAAAREERVERGSLRDALGNTKIKRTSSFLR